MKKILNIVKVTQVINSILLLFQTIIPFENLPTIISNVYDIIIPALGGIELVFWFLFTVLWRFKTINCFLTKIFDTNIYLQGTWYGFLESSYKGAEFREVFLVISQPDAFTIDCKLLTEHRTSLSKVSNIIDEAGTKKLIYHYFATQDKKYDDNNPMHSGTTCLDIGNKLLEGTYYTDNKTKGKIQFSKITKKKINIYKEAKSLIN